MNGVALPSIYVAEAAFDPLPATAPTMLGGWRGGRLHNEDHVLLPRELLVDRLPPPATGWRSSRQGGRTAQVPAPGRQ